MSPSGASRPGLRHRKTQNTNLNGRRMDQPKQQQQLLARSAGQQETSSERSESAIEAWEQQTTPPERQSRRQHEVSAVPDNIYGDNNVWKTANQMFGISSRVAAIMELIYIMNNKDMFTEFEYGFFVVASNSDTTIDISILLQVVLSSVLQGNCISTWKALKFLIIDPVHILAGVNLNADDTSREERLLICRTLFVFEVSMIYSLIIWAFYPHLVWNSGFTRNGWVLWASSTLIMIHNLGNICSVYRDHLRLSCCPVFSSGQFKLKYSLVSLMYIIEKMLKLYILLSNKERLVTGTAGELLVTFQAEKVFAAANFLFRLWVPE